MHIYVCDTAGASLEELKKAGMALQKRAVFPLRSYTSESAFAAHLAGRLLLDYVLRYVYAYNSYYKVVLSGSGKPSFVQSSLPFFSISHSSSFAAVVFSQQEIGLDIELLRKRRMQGDVAARFFSPQEYNYYCSRFFSQRQVAFYSIWTLKESYLKCRGTGISGGLQNFSLIPQKNAVLTENVDSSYSFTHTQKGQLYFSVCIHDTKNIGLSITKPGVKRIKLKKLLENEHYKV